MYLRRPKDHPFGLYVGRSLTGEECEGPVRSVTAANAELEQGRH